MPFYHHLGNLPHKRHTIFRKEDYITQTGVKQMSLGVFEGWDDWCHVDPNEPNNDDFLDDPIDDDEDDDDE